MANQDTGGDLMTAGGSPNADILKQLKIITFLLREGFGIKDEDASFSAQTLPSASTPGAL